MNIYKYISNYDDDDDDDDYHDDDKFDDDVEKLLMITITVLRQLRAEIRKYRESADRSEKKFFFFFHQKNPFG